MRQMLPPRTFSLFRFYFYNQENLLNLLRATHSILTLFNWISAREVEELARGVKN